MPSAAVVVSHFRMPIGRLLDWCGWNDAEFSRRGIGAVVVADGPREPLPPWARVVVYPAPMEIFSLSRSSNYGIRSAGEAGSEIVAKSDPDCIWSPQALDELQAVASGRGVSWTYLMAEGPSDAQRANARAWQATKGTVALAWPDWCRLCGYDERMSGYGVEDGDLFLRARKVLQVDQSRAPFWHVAHSPAPQHHGNRRSDCWGRASGFNPRAHDRNHTTRHGPAWCDPGWGRPSVPLQQVNL